MGQTEIVIGKAYDGRAYDELKAAIGLFAKYLPVSVNLKKNSSFKQLLEHVNQATQDIHQWQESFTWDLCRPETTTSIEEAFCPFAFDFAVQPEVYSRTDLKLSIHRCYACIDRYHLKLSCLQIDGALLAVFHYDSSVYLPEDIIRVAEEYQQLIRSVLTNLKAPLSELEILGPGRAATVASGI